MIVVEVVAVVVLEAATEAVLALWEDVATLLGVCVDSDNDAAVAVAVADDNVGATAVAASVEFVVFFDDERCNVTAAFS